MIAFENAITPTKLAEYLIQKFHNFSVPVQKAEEKIIDKSRRLISDEKSKFQSEIKLFRSVTNNMLLVNKNTLKENARSVIQNAHFIFKNEKEYLDNMKQSIIRNVPVALNDAGQLLIQFGQSIRKDAISQIRQTSLVLMQQVGQLLNASKIIFKGHNLELESIEKNVSNMSPQNVLGRGYSITTLNGRSIKTAEGIIHGAELITIPYNGSIASTVTSTLKEKNDE